MSWAHHICLPYFMGVGFLVALVASPPLPTQDGTLLVQEFLPTL